MSYYCTLAEARRELATQPTTTSATEDAKLLERIWQVSRRIDLEMASEYPVFTPTLGDWEVLVTPENVNSSRNTLQLPYPFVSISALSLSGTALVVGTDVAYYPTTALPYRELRMKGTTYNWYNRVCLSADSDPLMLTITGARAYRRAGGASWLKVDDLAADINASVTTLTVADIDGSDPMGRTPRLSAGNLIRIDSEYMDVLSTDTATNIATVQRGMNGTTAAAHTTGADVEVWQVEDSIRRVTARQAAALYARIGSYEEKTITEIGLIAYPKDLLAELRAVLQGYAYL